MKNIYYVKLPINLVKELNLRATYSYPNAEFCIFSVIETNPIKCIEDYSWNLASSCDQKKEGLLITNKAQLDNLLLFNRKHLALGLKAGDKVYYKEFYYVKAEVIEIKGLNVKIKFDEPFNQLGKIINTKTVDVGYLSLIESKI